MNAAAAPAVAARRTSRASTYRIVRQVHLWVGAWGALAAILFGVTGLVMNHRFGDGAWPQGESQETGRLLLEVPEAARTSPDALKAWLASEHSLVPQTFKKGKPDKAKLGGRAVEQPPRWNLSGGTAGRSWAIEYVPGNATAEVKQSRHSTLAALTRLHKGVNGGGLWTLLVDSFAIGMLLLGLSGIWMWARGRSPKEMLLSVFVLSTAVFGAVVALALA
ncbi:PepSY-associated TM helix domain-containing protein [Lysobacter humi (ex Lee et al. 2017)]